LARLVVIKGENTNECIDFGINILIDLGPQTEIEKNLCEKFIIWSWKLRRLHEAEKNLLNEQNRRLSDSEERKISLGIISGRRVRNIERIDMSDEGVINLTQFQFELEKRIMKTLDRLRREQNRRKNSTEATK